MLSCKNICPQNLFSEHILNFLVKTQKRGLVNYINLDNAATTPPLIEVERRVNEYIATYGSVHRGAGTKSKISTDFYEKSREFIKNFVNARSTDYVIFTPNTTGAINAAAYFFSFLSGKIMISSIEHSSSWLPWVKSEGIKLLGNQQNDIIEMNKINSQIQSLGLSQIIYYDIDDNLEFDLLDIENKLKNNKIKLLVLTASSNLTGYRPNIKLIGKLAHQYGAFILVDACQLIQHHRIDMQEMGIDFLVASGHKFYAPYGGGFLIGPKNFLDEFLPYQIGGGNVPYITKKQKFLRHKDQKTHDPGTPNAVGAVAMMTALETLEGLGIDNIEKYEANLATKLFNYLNSNPKIKLHVNKKHLSTVLPFSILGKNSIEIAETLNSDHGIGVRAGSFCVYNVIRKLLNITDEEDIVRSVKQGKTDKIPSLLRTSIGLCNFENEIDRFIDAIEELTR